ncbi:hypothetical protein DCS_07998 [Drechmeria coniospora]|uniref:Uncharacterized protein n=1 Tax=Drechmeria coniospora TaxID=98403 RepID=A0A151GG34_DRECN|nr:hypothetical protein DCS_07998 [Drechmeria coniospora]KYK56032.1 hypothetical protein DCS_07998 [Drechmeria coniospora]
MDRTLRARGRGRRQNTHEHEDVGEHDEWTTGPEHRSALSSLALGGEEEVDPAKDFGRGIKWDGIGMGWEVGW